MNPRDHAAVVTGGASGLGEETANRLARAGAKVAVLDLNGEAARKTASIIGGIGIACDVSDSDSTTAALKEAREKHGPARVVINCAGIGSAKRIVGRNGPMPLNDFQRVISVNLIGTFNVMRLAAAEMATRDGSRDSGKIVSNAETSDDAKERLRAFLEKRAKKVTEF
jgi:NAD(P)-dependent dehydrogenase (short-subunit alcohol dehydrogenase family)